MRQKKRGLNLILVLGAIVIVLFILTRSGNLNRSSNVDTRDISLSALCCGYPSLSAQTKADNFFIFSYNSAAKQLAPNSLSLYYDYISAIHDTQEGYSTMPENWFLHGAGLDPTNPDNRLRTIGYDEFALDISNSSLLEWEYNRLAGILASRPDMDGFTIDLVYPNLYPTYYTIIRAEPAITYDGLTVNVSKTPYVTPSVAWSLSSIKKITLDQAQTGQSKYGGSFSGNTIKLISDPDIIYTPNANMETYGSTSNTRYIGGYQPAGYTIAGSYNNLTFTTTLTRTSSAHSGTSAWILTANASDVTWSRRLSADTKTVGVGATVFGSVWVSPLGNVTNICVELESRRSGVAYGGPAKCVDMTNIVGWTQINISTTLSTNASCGGAPCDQVMFFVYANTMSQPIGAFSIDDFSLTGQNPLVPPNTTVYVTYGSIATKPNIDLINNYHYYMKNALAGIKQRFPNKVILFNQIEGTANADYVDVLDGAMDEGFIRAYYTIPNSESNVGSTGSSWKSEMNITQSVIKKGKYLTLDCGVYTNATPEYRQRVFNYCFSSYLLVQKKNQTTFVFEQYHNNTGWYFPEYDYKYGSPIGDYFQYSSSPEVYARNYTASMVFVNPTMANVQVTVPAGLYTRDDTLVTTATLNNRTGLVLYRHMQVIVNETNTTVTNNTITNTTITNNTTINNTITNNTTTNTTTNNTIPPEPKPKPIDIKIILIGVVAIVGGYLVIKKISHKGRRRR